jgi:puromycin-sensitive aminopeptidase
VRAVFDELGWTPRPGEDELTRQLRGDLVRVMGALGDDRAVQARAAELYARASELDPNVLPAIIGVLAHAGDGARYDEFLKRFRSASTPQEEQRYLYALAAFRQPELLSQTLARTTSGELRTQDAPFVVRALLTSVYGRELAWEFVKTSWDTMERQYPKAGLRRLAEGVIGLATPELERDVHAFFQARRPEFGGKTLEQYLEQLRVAVRLREREAAALTRYLARFA